MNDLPEPWDRYRTDLALAVFMAGVSIADFWMTLTLNIAAAQILSSPRSVTTLHLVASNGHLLDQPFAVTRVRIT